jgi:hypothetical protein
VTDLAILVPVLNRPHRVQPLLDSIMRAQPARVVFICDQGDNAEREAIRDADSALWIATLTVDGSYARKINQAIRCVPAERYFLGADDLIFQPGWYTNAKAKFAAGFSVVGINDKLRRAREHTTHFLITREYAEQGCIDGPGPLCEEYDHSFVDDEFIATAKHRGAYAYAPEAVVEHVHWMNGCAEDDDVYRKGRARFRIDRKTFARRTPLWT